MITKDDYKALSVILGEYSDFDIADHLADYVPSEVYGDKSIWEMSASELMQLAQDKYPGGLLALQVDLADYVGVWDYDDWLDEIDVILFNCHRASVDDLPDYLYRDDFEKGLTPWQTYQNLLAGSWGEWLPRV